MKFYIISLIAFLISLLVVLPKTQRWFFRKPPSKKRLFILYIGLFMMGFGILTYVIADLI